MALNAKSFQATITKRVSLGYWLSLPKGYRGAADARWPLVLFLHGAGERGDELAAVKKHGVRDLAKAQAQYPCILVAPQCPLGTWWVEQVDALAALLDEIVTTYRVDVDRVYLTGLSVGGYGTWHLAAAYPQRFAAAVPICGGGVWWQGFPEKAAVLKDLPLWVFHGADDDVVPLSESQRLVDVLTAHGSNVRFTVYPDTGHDSWTRTYRDPALYEWLFAQRKGAA